MSFTSFLIVTSNVSVSSGFVGSSVSSPIKATFVIFPSILFTLIVNTTFALPFAGTTIFSIPLIKSCAVLSVDTTSSPLNIVTFPTISAFSSAKIPSKLLSLTVVVPSLSPVFVIEIVYVISSPIIAGSETT